MIKPMIMSSPSVKALLDGCKTMTRRVITKSNSIVVPKTPWNHLDFSQAYIDKGPSPAGNPGPYLHVPDINNDDEIWVRVYPRMQVDDIVYIKETFTTAPFPCAHLSNGDFRVIYKAGTNDLFQWKPALFMPKKFARLWYPITGVGAGQVQEISWSDVMAEGVDFMGALPHPLSVPRLNKKKD